MRLISEICTICINDIVIFIPIQITIKQCLVFFGTLRLQSYKNEMNDETSSSQRKNLGGYLTFILKRFI